MIWSYWSLDLIIIGSTIYGNTKCGRLITCSDGNMQWKLLFGSYILRHRLKSVITKYSKHPHQCGDWQLHIHLKTLDSSTLKPCRRSTFTCSSKLGCAHSNSFCQHGSHFVSPQAKFLIRLFNKLTSGSFGHAIRKVQKMYIEKRISGFAEM